MIKLKFNELKNVKKWIGIWLALDVIAALIYIIAAIVNENNIIVVLLISLSLIIVPLFMFLLVDAVLKALLDNGSFEGIKQKEIVVSTHKQIKQEVKAPIEVVPKTRYSSDIIINKPAVLKNDYAFHKELESVALGEDVKAIQKHGFYGCSNLKEINIAKRGLVKIGAQALGMTPEDLKIYVHEDDINLYMSDPGWEPYMKNIYPIN